MDVLRGRGREPRGDKGCAPLAISHEIYARRRTFLLNRVGSLGRDTRDKAIFVRSLAFYFLAHKVVHLWGFRAKLGAFLHLIVGGGLISQRKALSLDILYLYNISFFIYIRRLISSLGVWGNFFFIKNLK
jgi:hypothetical protein